MQKRHVLVLAVVAVAVAVVAWWRWPRGEPPSTSIPQGSDRTLAADPGSSAPGRVERGRATSHVRRLDPGDRLELYGKIQAAIARARGDARRASASGSAALAGDDLAIPLEEVSDSLQDALRDAIPLLADCLPSRAGKTAAAMMKMASDPDLGTVIDTEAITDADGNPLDAKVDECLRDTIDSLALPGLGRRGTLELQYTFRFD